MSYLHRWSAFPSPGRDRTSSQPPEESGFHGHQAAGTAPTSAVEAVDVFPYWFRRLRIRWEVRDDIHEAFLTLGMAVICRQRLKTRFHRTPQHVHRTPQLRLRQSLDLPVHCIERARIECISVMGRQPTSRCARPAERDRIGVRTP
ncbi:hypothetical protein [Streptomyces sp. NPDC001269]